MPFWNSIMLWYCMNTKFEAVKYFGGLFTFTNEILLGWEICFAVIIFDGYQIITRLCTMPRSTWHMQILLRSLNTLRPRQNGRHFADDTFKYIFLNENVIIPAKISLKFVPKGPINNIPALVQIMAWRRPGDKPLSEPMMVRLPTHICVTWPQWVNQNNNIELFWVDMITCTCPNLKYTLFKGLIMVGREFRQQHPSDLLSGAGTSRERSSRDVPAGQQITRVLLP